MLYSKRVWVQNAKCGLERELLYKYVTSQKRLQPAYSYITNTHFYPLIFNNVGTIDFVLFSTNIWQRNTEVYINMWNLHNVWKDMHSTFKKTTPIKFLFVKVGYFLIGHQSRISNVQVLDNYSWIVLRLSMKNYEWEQVKLKSSRGIEPPKYW